METKLKYERLQDELLIFHAEVRGHKINWEDMFYSTPDVGCDYSNGISNINYQVIYKYYSETKNIDETLISLKKNNFNVPDKLEYEHIKEYYLNAPFHEINPCDLKFNLLQYDNLLNLLVTKYGLIKFKIVSKLKKIVHIMKSSHILIK
jgi:hypothetical protein